MRKKGKEPTAINPGPQPQSRSLQQARGLISRALTGGCGPPLNFFASSHGNSKFSA